MTDFGKIMKAMAVVNEEMPDMNWRITSDGILKVEAYVGIANYDLYRQATQMFAPASPWTDRFDREEPPF